MAFYVYKNSCDYIDRRGRTRSGVRWIARDADGELVNTFPRRCDAVSHLKGNFGIHSEIQFARPEV